jgi:hypothetical protein
VTVQRVAGDVEADVIGQLDRQVFLLLGTTPQVGAMDHRNRAAPIALARNAPVAQAVLGDALAIALRLGMGDGGGHASSPVCTSAPAKAADIAHRSDFIGT